MYVRNVLRKCKNNDHITEMHKIANDEIICRVAGTGVRWAITPLNFGIFKQNLFHGMNLC